MNKFHSIIVLIIFSLSAANVFAGQNIKISNHSFGVIKEDDNRSSDDTCSQVTIFIKNENCIATYKTAVGDVILGEGEINFTAYPQTIQLGKTKFRVGCQVSGDLTFVSQ